MAYDVSAAAIEPDPDVASNREAGRYVIGRSLDAGDGGSGMERYLPELRRFRDRYLMSSRAGQAFVRWCYRVSPPVAGVMAQHEILRSAVRLVFTPVVYAIVYPLALALAVAGLLAGLGFMGWSRQLRPAYPRLFIER